MIYCNCNEGGKQMQIEIKIDNNFKEPKAVIYTNEVTDEITEFVRQLSDERSNIIAGFKDGTAELLEPENIFRIYASNGKVCTETDSGTFTLRLRLYEMEQRLDNRIFVRISNSEIINLKKVKNFDLSFVGTICVKLSNGTVTYVSRRYVAKIKQILGI